MTEKLSRRTLLGGTAAIAGLNAFSAPLGPAFAQAPGKQPNILFIVADDLGYADLSCYGARTIRTPNIDRLAAEGIQLSDGYANSPVCSPTRVALMTGRYQYRLRAGLDEPISRNPDVGLPPEHPTLPSLLRRVGYTTSLVGKWHLGFPPKFGPLKSGYDRFFGIHEGGADYFRHELVTNGKPEGGLFDGDRLVEREGYMTSLLGRRAVEEIEAAARARKPFFMSLHFTAPHWPWEGPEDEAAARALRNTLHLDGGNLDTYRRMVESMDVEVGRVFEALEQNGLASNTIVAFTSDNGGERFSDTWPFVGAKTELLEGGIRVPILMRWPGRIAPGSRSAQVMITMDFLPTLLAAADASPDPRYPPDGENLLPVLTGAAQPRPRTLFWRYKAEEQAAVRDGDWKYLKIRNREYLFNLAQDQRERANLRETHPDRFQALKAKFAAWNATMLPYPKDSYSTNMAGYMSDRY